MRKSNSIALSGIFLGLSLITLYFESVLPTGRLALFALSSFFVGIIVIEGGIRDGWIFYFAVAILAFFLVPDKLNVFPYVFFFGIYPLVKYYIEKLHKKYFEIVLKLTLFNAVLVVAFLFAKELLFAQIDLDPLKYPLIAVFLIAQIVFFVYDYAFSSIIRYYLARKPM